MTTVSCCRLSTVRNANNIVVMKAGQIAEQGTHAQLMRTRGIYHSLVKRQAGDGTLGTEEAPDKKVGPVPAAFSRSQHTLDAGGLSHMISSGPDRAAQPVCWWRLGLTGKPHGIFSMGKRDALAPLSHQELERGMGEQA